MRRLCCTVRVQLCMHAVRADTVHGSVESLEGHVRAGSFKKGTHHQSCHALATKSVQAHAAEVLVKVIVAIIWHSITKQHTGLRRGLFIPDMGLPAAGPHPTASKA